MLTVQEGSGSRSPFLATADGPLRVAYEPLRPARGAELQARPGMGERPAQARGRCLASQICQSVPSPPP